MLGEVEKLLASRPGAAGRAAGQRRGPEASMVSSSIAARRHCSATRNSPGLTLPTNLDSDSQGGRGSPGVFAYSAAKTTGRSAIFPRRSRAISRPRSRKAATSCSWSWPKRWPPRALRAWRPRLADPRERRPSPAQPFAAYHLKKASCLAIKGDRDGAARELAEAARLRPETAFDYLPERAAGVQANSATATRSRTSRCALRHKPDHFWAKCLQAICYIQTQSYAAAKSSLDRLHRDRPRFRLAISAPRIRQRPARRAQTSNLSRTNPGREKPLKDAAEFEFDEAEDDFKRALEKLTIAPDHELHVHPARQPRPGSIPARSSRPGRRRLPGSHPLDRKTGSRRMPSSRTSMRSSTRSTSRSSSSRGPSPSNRTGRPFIAGERRCSPPARTRPARRAAALADLDRCDPVPAENLTIRSWPWTIPIGACSCSPAKKSKMPSRRASSPWRSNRLLSTRTRFRSLSTLTCFRSDA